MTEEKYLRSLGAWDCRQDNPHHIYTVGEHTEKAVAWCKAHGASDDVIRAAWLHDCGKMQTRVRRLKRGAWIDTFYGHAEASARLAEQFGESPYVVKLIRYHDIAIGTPSDATLRKLAANGRQWCEDLALLMQADLAAQHPTYQVAEKAKAKEACLQRLFEAVAEYEHGT